MITYGCNKHQINYKFNSPVTQKYGIIQALQNTSVKFVFVYLLI
jgi:hypothetical protein